MTRFNNVIEEASKRNYFTEEEGKELRELLELEADGVQQCFIPTNVTDNNCNLNCVIESQLKNCYRNTNERIIRALTVILSDLYSCKECGLCRRADL